MSHRSISSHADHDLLQSEKLRAVGQLAAGIAHEINTPIQFVGDNISACAEIFEDLRGLIDEYRALLDRLEISDAHAEQVARIRRREAEIDLDYIFQDAPAAFSQSLEGIDQVRTIVQAMKDFSHTGPLGQKTFFDVNAALTSALTVCRNEIKYVADVRTEFADAPPVWGAPAELNQVFVNLLVNAAHAIREKCGHERGAITVRTASCDEWVVVSVGDTGCGIPPAARSRIFEPFFTTKEVGCGTGQGLAISRRIVVDRHGGRIDLDTELGVGTTFHLYLPTRSGRQVGDGSEIAWNAEARL